MSDELKCNNLECRLPLNHRGQAVVTTCSHIFCVTCANDLFAQTSACPACQQDLTEPGDIVSTFLNPSHDYKGTVLAGLPPATIMEIAGRALGFWTYQMSQQSAFQSMMLKNQEKSMAKKDQQVSMINGQLGMSQRQVEGLQGELEKAHRKIQQLSDQVKENDKEMRQMRGRYDQVKRRALLGGNLQEPAPPPRSSQPVKAQGPRPFVATPVGRTGQPRPLREMVMNQQASSEASDKQRKGQKSATKLAQRRAVGSKEYGM